MASITVRVGDDAHGLLRQGAVARGMTLSAYVRSILLDPESVHIEEDYASQIDNLEARLSRLEEMAGL